MIDFKPIMTTLTVLTLALGSLACSPGEEPEAQPQAPEAKAEGDPQVTYEPAYPEDVSEEGLSQEDEAQQESQHSHDPGEDQTHEHDGTRHTH